VIKKITIFLALVAMIAAAGYGYITKQVEQYVTQPLQIEQDQIFTLKSGTSFNRVLAQLTEQGWIKSNDVSRLVRRLHPELTQLRLSSRHFRPERANPVTDIQPSSPLDHE